jgi:hypothetical protein
MQELKHRPGCFGTLAGGLVFSMTGGLGYLLEPYIGDAVNLIMIAGLIATVAVGIGVARKARWAVVLSGIFLVITGAAMAVFILIDFGTSLLTGKSRLSGAGGESYGQAVAIILATGLTLVLLGTYLIRGKAISELVR